MARSIPTIDHDNRRWFTLGAMCFALFMVMLDNTVVNVALPSIQRDLDVPISALEWTVNAYTLTFAVLLVTGGRLGDIFGRRRVFIAGVIVFGLSSLFIAFSQTDTWLIVGRAAQGVGAAFMMPATLSIITNAFPPHERGKAIGTWAGVSAIALAIGPVVGGFLVENVSWQSIFLINVPIAVIAVGVTLWAAHESRDESAPRVVDYPGVVTIGVGLGAFVLALVEGNSWGWGSARILGLFAVSAVSLVAFVRAERRSPAPMVDFTYFRSRSFLGSNIVAFIVSFAMLAMFFFLALYMQNIRGYSPLRGGRALPPLDGRDHLHGPRRRPPGGQDRPADPDDDRPRPRRDLTVLAGPPRRRHELRLPRRRVRADGHGHGPRDVADEHRRDEQRRSGEGRRRLRRAVDEPHGGRHVRRRGRRRADQRARPLAARGPASAGRPEPRSAG